MVEIKTVAEEHLLAVAQLQRAFIEEHYAYDKDYYQLAQDASTTFTTYVHKEMLNNPNKIMYVACDPDTQKIVGYISGWIDHKAPIYHTTTYGFLSNIYVIASHRGQGIARQLIETLMHWFKQKGIRHVELTVDVRNTDAIAAFEKHGFKEFLKRMRLSITDSQPL